jgi:prepilin-type N-terminal cleavage/methylation domain-containing protein
MRCSAPRAASRPTGRDASTATRPAARGLTLVELLIAIVVVSIVAAMLMPQLGRQIPDQLTAVAEIVAADLEYARSLAVVNNSTYRVEFSVADNRYILRHSGANTLLHVLPASPFRQNDDAPDEQTTDLADLPLSHPVVRLAQVASGSGTVTAVSDVEFTAVGGTTRTSITTVWLACGEGAESRYIPVAINPVTGLIEVGELSKAMPTEVVALVAQSAD